MPISVRTDPLLSLGASSSEADELRNYNRTQFRFEALPSTLALPLADEPFVSVWEEYIADSAMRGAFEVLQERLIQFRFPIRAGISRTTAYLAATRRGWPPEPDAEGLRLAAPHRLRLALHPTAAGRVPVLIVGERADFVAVLRALARRNEPEPIPESLGALMISGYNNWDRLTRLRQRHELGQLAIPGANGWSETFAHIKERREEYQDRLLVVGTGPYSGVAADTLGLPTNAWHHVSLRIRLEHESAHYLTRRLLGSMRNNLLDELIADYAGIVAAVGKFNGGWLLHFLGVEDGGCIRPGGRLYNYRGNPPLSEGAFVLLGRLAVNACSNIEAADRSLAARNRSPEGRVRMLLALARLSLEELAGGDAIGRIRTHFDATRVSWVNHSAGTSSVSCHSLRAGGAYAF